MTDARRFAHTMHSPALLVIDIQRAAFDGVRCPPIDSPDRLVRNACRLVEAARAANRPIVFVQHCDEVGQPFEPGTPHWDLHDSLAPNAGDAVVRKHASSSFEGTELEALLMARSVTELVLCGLQSEFCVSNTARSALALGYTVHVARDGHSTWPSEGRTADEIEAEVNARLGDAGAVVTTTDNLASALRQPRN
jgi:nicotinamidase-related amidase